MLYFRGMEKFIFRLAWVWGLGLLLTACANIVPPVGGEKDETPPGLVLEKSTPNLQTSFTQKRIELTFDEWVTLKNIRDQVVVSPPLRYDYDLKLRRKTLVFEFDEREELLDSVTYVINFGEAVQDITEGNPAENLRYVFSTGPQIDSLSLSGEVRDARTGEPVQGALFMLYKNFEDSVVRTERPFYFARTGENGTFLIENIRKGTYKGFALQDADGNYRYNQASEAIGFPDKPIIVPNEGRPIRIRLSTETPPLRLLGSDVRNYGRIGLLFSEVPDSLVKVSALEGDRLFNREISGDSLIIWYAQNQVKDWSMVVRRDTHVLDTLRIHTAGRSKVLAPNNLHLQTPDATVLLPPGKALEVVAPRPLLKFDEGLISLTTDSTDVPVQADFSFNKEMANRALRVDFSRQVGQRYILTLMPGALTDLHGMTNQDTIQYTFKGGNPEDLGQINLSIINAEAEEAYVFTLLDSREKRIDRWQVIGDTSYRRKFPYLVPGDYTFEVIIDTNRNGRWDPAVYSKRQQSERVFLRSLEKLRANWEVEAEVDLQNMTLKQ